MNQDRLGQLLRRRQEISAELRARLGLPEWSNLRGDDVIMLVESLDEASRVHAGNLIAELREIEDERLGG